MWTGVTLTARLAKERHQMSHKKSAFIFFNKRWVEGARKVGEDKTFTDEVMKVSTSGTMRSHTYQPSISDIVTTMRVPNTWWFPTNPVIPTLEGLGVRDNLSYSTTANA